MDKSIKLRVITPWTYLVLQNKIIIIGQKNVHLKNRTEFKPHAKVVCLLASQFREPKLSMWDGESIRVQPGNQSLGCSPCFLPACSQREKVLPHLHQEVKIIEIFPALRRGILSRTIYWSHHLAPGLYLYRKNRHRHS